MRGRQGKLKKKGEMLQKLNDRCCIIKARNELQPEVHDILSNPRRGKTGNWPRSTPIYQVSFKRQNNYKCCKLLIKYWIWDWDWIISKICKHTLSVRLKEIKLAGSPKAEVSCWIFTLSLDELYWVSKDSVGNKNLILKLKLFVNESGMYLWKNTR